MKCGGRLIAVAIGLALMVGCQSEPDRGMTPRAPSSSGNQSPSSSESSPTPTPGVGTSSKQELLAEAEQTYRAYVMEARKVEAAGGTDRLPEAMTQYLLEPYLSVVQKTYADLKATKVTIANTQGAELKYVKPADESSKEGALVALTTCIDSSQLTITWPDGHQTAGNIARRTLYFRRDQQGRLRIFSGNSTLVDKC